MKIVIDGRCLLEKNKTGVQVFTENLIKKTLLSDSKNKYIIFLNSFKKKYNNLSWLSNFSNVEIKNFGFPNKIFNFFLWFLSFPHLDKLLGEADLFFLPNLAFCSFSSKAKIILVIHDLSFKRFKNFFSFKRRLWHFFVNPRKLCQKAFKIVAVSQSTKEDLIEFYQINPQKIIVAYPNLFLSDLLVNDDKKEQKTIEKLKSKIRQKNFLNNPFILFLGTIEPRKNLVSLLLAFQLLKKNSEIKKKFPKLQLVAAGGKGWLWKKTIKVAQQSIFRKDLIFLNFVSQEEKKILYQKAQVFVFPSFFEGFGFPPLEAFAFGKPVITSNCSSLPEVVEDQAILVDPYRPFEIYLALKIYLLESDSNLKEIEKENKNWFKERIKQKYSLLDFLD